MLELSAFMTCKMMYGEERKLQQETFSFTYYYY
jgi:hypothetical protein